MGTLLIALAVCGAGADVLTPAGTPWSSGSFMLTEKHLLEYDPDGSVKATRRTDGEKFFVSRGGDTVCRVTRGKGALGTVRFRRKSGPLRGDAAYAGHVGDVFFGQGGAYIFLNGFGVIGEYNALGVTFFNPKGEKISSVRANGSISEASLSRDTTALLISTPQDRKKPNHINVLSLYALDGERKWQVNTAALRQAGQSVHSRVSRPGL